MTWVIVPLDLRKKLYQLIDTEIDRITNNTERKEARGCRDLLYAQLLSYYSEHGEIPEFTLVKRP